MNPYGAHETRVVNSSVDGTLLMVEQTVQDIGMQIEHLNDDQRGGKLIVASFINAQARGGGSTGAPAAHVLEILIEPLSANETRVVVQARGSEQYGARGGNEQRERFFRALDRRLGV
jgi:hypothetical protein